MDNGGVRAICQSFVLADVHSVVVMVADIDIWDIGSVYHFLSINATESMLCVLPTSCYHISFCGSQAHML